MIRLVVVICLFCAVLLDARYTKWSGKETGETALLRQMFGTFQPGDIVLADRCHCTYATIAALLKREADGCFRLHQSRTSIAKSGTVLGKGDFLGFWTRPTDKPKWMPLEEYLALPERIEIREVHFEVKIPGFRVEKVIVATPPPGSPATIRREVGLASVSATSLTGLHEFGHASSSFTVGMVVDQYVDGSVGVNNKKGRPIPVEFAALDGTVYATDSARDGLGYPATWTSYHPALTNPAVPSLMDNYWLAPGGMPEACMFDTLTRQFLRDRLLAKLSRP